MATTILNVDDNDAGRYAVSRILRHTGFDVLEAATGTNALEMLQDGQPDIILLDVNLPDISGFEVCRRIKNDSRTALIPVLMMSASLIRDKDRVRGLEGGADGYLTGPLDPEVLIATVHSLLRIRTAEEALQAQARRWQTTFDAIGDGVVLLDAAGAIIQSNRAFISMLDKPPEEIIGSRCGDLMNLSGRQLTDFPCSSPFAEHRRESSDLQLGARWFHITVDPVRNTADDIDGAVCIFSDITERKLFEQELQQAKDAAEAADRAKDQFLAVLSHELRTPLTPVLTAVQALREELELPAELALYVDVIHRNVELEARLIDDLLDLTGIAREKVRLNFETVDAHSLLDNVLDICRHDIGMKKLRLSVELGATRHHLWVDPARMQQVFWNLVKNAVKFTSVGGSLSIRSELLDDDILRVTVTDSGIGIEQHILPRIFDAFEQGEQNITRQFGGLGLGLAISKALVEMLGGTLTASSAGKDMGASFTVELPTVHPPTNTAAPAATDGGTEHPARPLRILIVDDHADTSRVMQLLLERRGYQIRTAASVSTALEAADEGEYDLLISDIGLPDGSGLDLMRKLSKRNKPLVGVALSGFGMEDDIQKSIEAGFAEHLTKPVNFKQLQDVIQRLAG